MFTSQYRRVLRVLMPVVLRENRAFARLWGATFISGVGSLSTFIALPLVAYERTGSGATFASIMAATTAGTLLMVLFGGAFADRGDRQRLLLAGDALLFVEVIAMGVCVHLGAWAACAVVAFLQAATSATFRGASPALQRDLVPAVERVSANAVTQLQMNLTSFAAPLLGAGLYPVVGFLWLVALDAATFAISFLLLLRVHDPLAQARRRATGTRLAGEAVKVLREVSVGVRVGVRDRYAGPEILAAMLSGIGNGMFIVAVVPWLDWGLGLPAAAFGVVIAVVGLAGIIAALVVTRIAANTRPGMLVIVGACCGIIGSLGFLGTPPLWLLAPCLLAFGVANVVASIGASTITQARFPSALQGRLGSLQQVSFQGCSLMGVVIAGAIAGGSEQLPITAFAVLIIAANALFLLALRGARTPVAAHVKALADIESREAAMSERDLATSA